MTTNDASARSEQGVVISILMPHAPVLVPAISGGRLSDIGATVQAMREVARRVVETRPDGLIGVSPHSPRQHDAFGVWGGDSLDGSLAHFGAPEATVHFPNDPLLAATIRSAAEARGVATWEIPSELLDHGAVVPLWFLAEAGWRGPTVFLSLNYPGEGGLRELGEAIAAAAAQAKRRLAFLASGDMSHRLLPGSPSGFHPLAGAFDRQFIALLKRGAYGELERLDPELQDLAAEDVVQPTVIGAAASCWDARGHQVLSYEGPFGVGYGVALLSVKASP